MKRRAFLKSAVAGLALFQGRGFSATALPDLALSAVQQSFVVLSDIAEDVSFPHLIAVLDALTERNIPVVCSVAPFAPQGVQSGLASKVSQLLSGYLLGGASIEMAPYLADLGKQSPHFQARSVFEGSLALHQLLPPSQVAKSGGRGIQTVVCDAVENPTAPIGVRSGGIYNVLVQPKTDEAVRSQTWGNGTVRLFGGQQISLHRYAALPASVDEEATQRLFYLSARSFSKLPLQDLEVAANQFCEDLLLAELEGDLSLQTAADLQLRNDYGFRRHVSWVLARPSGEAQDLQAAFDAFKQALISLKVPFVEAEGDRDVTTETSRGFWVAAEPRNSVSGQSADWPEMVPIEIHRTTSDRPITITTTRPIGPGVGVAFQSRLSGQRGIDGAGILNLTRMDVKTADDLPRLKAITGGMDDLVVHIYPQILRVLPIRRALLAAISDIQKDNVTGFLSLDDFARYRLATDPISTRRRRAASAQPELGPGRTGVTKETRARLLKDAEIAWRYFERFTNKTTGLCPATVNSAPGGRLHETVTMWDVGSHINGLIAATQIGLIDRDFFDKSIRQILPNIVGRLSQGRHLPQGWIRTDRHKWGNKNFDGSDAGRLLSTLDNLRRFGGFEDQLVDLVNSWDLQDIIIDGQIHSVIDGELATSYVSHSGHYSALAFRRWGLAAKSPYEVFRGRSETDDQMALLEAVARIGPIGAEPLLLEAMEMGMSQESAYLADVLFTAQLEEYRETGQLTCVSEGPIDLKPWFTYQGLQLDTPKRTWATDTVGQEPEYRTPEFRENFLVVSSKSAFLWAAYQPHEYSETLVRYVRSKSETENGFSSSIFVKTGRPTTAYTDLNTNGIILQAIAHHLGVAS